MHSSQLSGRVNGSHGQVLVICVGTGRLAKGNKGFESRYFEKLPQFRSPWCRPFGKPQWRVSLSCGWEDHEIGKVREDIPSLQILFEALRDPDLNMRVTRYVSIRQLVSILSFMRGGGTSSAYAAEKGRDVQLSENTSCLNPIGLGIYLYPQQ